MPRPLHGHFSVLHRKRDGARQIIFAADALEVPHMPSVSEFAIWFDPDRSRDLVSRGEEVHDKASIHRPMQAPVEAGEIARHHRVFQRSLLPINRVLHLQTNHVRSFRHIAHLHASARNGVRIRFAHCAHNAWLTLLRCAIALPGSLPSHARSTSLARSKNVLYP